MDIAHDRMFRTVFPARPVAVPYVDDPPTELSPSGHFLPDEREGLSNGGGPSTEGVAGFSAPSLSDDAMLCRSGTGRYYVPEQGSDQDRISRTHGQNRFQDG